MSKDPASKVSELDALGFFDKFMDIEEAELSRFIMQNGIKDIPSAYRAFKFGIKNVFLTPDRIEDLPSGIRIRDLADAIKFIELYRNHFMFFKAIGKVNIPLESWIPIHFNTYRVQLLLQIYDANQVKTFVAEIKKAMEMARNAGWNGRIFYRTMNAGGQVEIK